MAETLNKSQEHLRIAALVPETMQIAESSRPNNLGSFIIDQVVDGEYVPLDSRTAVETDFGNIDVLNQDIENKLAEYLKGLELNPKKAELLEKIGSLPKDRARMYTSAMFATDLAKQFFNDQLVDKKVRDKTGWIPVDSEREDTYKTKKVIRIPG
jgi:hypothetical protein